ncbi:MAG: hypothetical protein OXC40_01740 [Proteobacteria bacterium]|nr:hypothetical protein [Pseudomonadota bacterium]
MTFYTMNKLFYCRKVIITFCYLLANVILISGCKTHLFNTTTTQVTSQNQVSPKQGEPASCDVIYKHRPIMSLLNIRSLSCDPAKPNSYFGTRAFFNKGVYSTSIEVLSQIIKAKPDKNNRHALEIVKYTPIFLQNLMRNENFPIHPAAFLAVIKDYETGNNIFEWGNEQFRCHTPGMCQNKCFYDDDCPRYCQLRYSDKTELTACSKTCQQKNKICSDHCYGLFQVDPEIENLRLGSDVGSKRELVLWPPDLIPWDFQKICGKSGLDVIGIEGGPDYCALLFWLFIGEGNRKCERFALEDVDQFTVVTGGKNTTKYRNPCKDEGYSWSLKNITLGPDAYQQAQKSPDAWVTKYRGYYNRKLGKIVHGYEQCAVSGFLDYNPFIQQTVSIPSDVLRASVLDYGCQIGVLPPWADLDECKAKKK